MGNYLLSLLSTVPKQELETILEDTAEKSEPASWLVCLLGIAVVFGGLLLLIGLVDLMNAFFRKAPKKDETASAVASPATAAPQIANTPIENKQELIAAICAAVAEENGTDISAIRVVSFKKL